MRDQHDGATAAVAVPSRPCGALLLRMRIHRRRRAGCGRDRRAPRRVGAESFVRPTFLTPSANLAANAATTIFITGFTIVAIAIVAVCAS